LLLQAKSATPSISSPFYPKDVGAFSLQRIDFIEQNTKLFTSLLSENDIGWQTFTMLFRGRKYTLTSFAPHLRFWGCLTC